METSTTTQTKTDLGSMVIEVKEACNDANASSMPFVPFAFPDTEIGSIWRGVG